MKKFKKAKQTWDNLTKATANKIKNYEKSDSFYTGDIINHQNFGAGYVQLTFGNKIEVLFEDKVRTLIHKVLF